MTSKLLTIGVHQTCEPCPHRSGDYQVGKPYFCEADSPRKHVGIVHCADDPIPAWCPLPDATQADPETPVTDQSDVPPPVPMQCAVCDRALAHLVNGAWVIEGHYAVAAGVVCVSCYAEETP
jgi:hypothetical protein